MKFLLNGDFNNNRLLKIILVFTLIYVAILWVTNLLLYIENIGFTYTSVVKYYLGAEEEFKNPVSFRGLLEVTHFHLFAFAMVLLLMNHLTVFTGLSQLIKLSLIIISFLSGLGDIGAGWLIRFVSPSFAYIKIGSFIVFQVTFLLLIFFSFFALRIYNKGRENGRSEIVEGGNRKY
ncbi:MAG: hypothetical protein AABY44_02035 [Nitrospirota bacterium]